MTVNADYCRATDIDVKVTLAAFDDQGNPYDLTGATCVCFVKFPDGSATNQIAMTLDAGNLSASFFTAVDTFPVGGLYSVEMLATFLDGRTRRSEILPWPVGAVLG